MKVNETNVTICLSWLRGLDGVESLECVGVGGGPSRDRSSCSLGAEDREQASERAGGAVGMDVARIRRPSGRLETPAALFRKARAAGIAPRGFKLSSHLTSTERRSRQSRVTPSCQPNPAMAPLLLVVLLLVFSSCSADEEERSSLGASTPTSETDQAPTAEPTTSTSTTEEEELPDDGAELEAMILASWDQYLAEALPVDEFNEGIGSNRTGIEKWTTGPEQARLLTGIDERTESGANLLFSLIEYEVLDLSVDPESIPSSALLLACTRIEQTELDEDLELLAGSEDEWTERSITLELGSDEIWRVAEFQVEPGPVCGRSL